MFLQTINDYSVPNTGHNGTFQANNWYLIENNGGISNAIILLSNGMTLAIVNNIIKVIYNYSDSDITIKTYYNGSNEFYLSSNRPIDYTWLGALNAPLTDTGEQNPATNFSTYKISSGNSNTNYNTASGIYYGTTPTPPTGLPTGSLYIYYSGGTSS